MAEEHGRLRAVGFTLLGFFAWGSTFLSRTALSYFAQSTSGRLELTATELGIINLGTSVAFCISSIVVGSIADRKQNHGSLLALSCGFTAILMLLTNAVAADFGLLLTVRTLLGLACGPVFALATALARQAATPSQFPLALGVVANGEAIFASTLGPILIVALMTRMDWTAANTLLTIPVLTVAAFTYFATRRLTTPPPTAAALEDQARNPVAEAVSLLRYRNVWLSTLLSILSMVALWTVLIYGPMFWTGPGQTTAEQMGLLMTLMGLTYGIWNFILPALSNRIGRKPVCVLAGLAGAIAMAALWLAPASAIAAPLFILFGGISSSISVLYMGLIPVESVPQRVATSSCALVVGASELIGVALGPLAAGLVADNVGIPAAMGLGAGCMAATALLAVALRESVTTGRRIGPTQRFHRPGGAISS